MLTHVSRVKPSDRRRYAGRCSRCRGRSRAGCWRRFRSRLRSRRSRGHPYRSRARGPCRPSFHRSTVRSIVVLHPEGPSARSAERVVKCRLGQDRCDTIDALRESQYAAFCFGYGYSLEGYDRALASGVLQGRTARHGNSARRKYVWRAIRPYTSLVPCGLEHRKPFGTESPGQPKRRERAQPGAVHTLCHPPRVGANRPVN